MPQGSKVAPADAIVNLHAVFTRYAPFSSDACLITNSRKITAPGRRAEEEFTPPPPTENPNPKADVPTGEPKRVTLSSAFVPIDTERKRRMNELNCP